MDMGIQVDDLVVVVGGATCAGVSPSSGSEGYTFRVDRIDPSGLVFLAYEGCEEPVDCCDIGYLRPADIKAGQAVRVVLSCGAVSGPYTPSIRNMNKVLRVDRVDRDSDAWLGPLLGGGVLVDICSTSYLRAVDSTFLKGDGVNYSRLPKETVTWFVFLEGEYAGPQAYDNEADARQAARDLAADLAEGKVYVCRATHVVEYTVEIKETSVP